MWYSVIVKADNTVIVRPDMPDESDASYHAAHEGKVFEHRLEIDLPEQAPDDAYTAMFIAGDVLDTVRDTFRTE